VPTADVQEFQRRGRTVPQLVVQQSFDGEKETEQVRIGGEMVRPLVGGNGMLRQFFQAIEENDGTNDLPRLAVGGDKKFHRFCWWWDGWIRLLKGVVCAVVYLHDGKGWSEQNLEILQGHQIRIRRAVQFENLFEDFHVLHKPKLRLVILRFFTLINLFLIVLNPSRFSTLQYIFNVLLPREHEVFAQNYLRIKVRISGGLQEEFVIDLRIIIVQVLITFK